MRSTRSGRIAACTALAVAAGMLLSGPVSASEKPVPTAKAERPKVDERATGIRPEAPATKATARTAAAAALPQLFDVDGDGLQDMLYRGLSGKSYLKTFTGEDPEYGVDGAAAGLGSSYGEDFKDVIPAGDLDRDGHPELLTLSVSGKLSLLRAETYGASRLGWSGNGWNIYNKVVGVGDLTGDGNPDLLARTYAGALYLYPGNGTAASASPYGSRISLGGGWDIYSQIVGGGDFNADGKADLLAATPGGTLYVYPGTGNRSGVFGNRTKSSTGWNMYNQLQVLTNKAGGNWLLGRDSTGRNWIYRSNGAGGFAEREAFGKGWEYTDLFAGQGGVPAHGRSELVGRTSGGAVYYYYGKQNGGFGDRQKMDGEAPISQVGMAVASSFGSQNEAGWLFWGGGKLYIDGNYAGAGWDIYNSLVGVGDVDGDGNGDLLARDKSNVLWLYPSYGNGYQFRNRVRLGAGWGGYNKLFGAGDVTGDGRADLLARGTDGTLWVYPGNGTAGFGDRVKIGDGGWNTLKKLAAVGDITGDGRADLVGVNSAGTAYLYKATGLKGLNTFKGNTSLGGGWNAYVNVL